MTVLDRRNVYACHVHMVSVTSLRRAFVIVVLGRRGGGGVYACTARTRLMMVRMGTPHIHIQI